MGIQADTEPITSRIAECERVRTCRPAVAGRGGEPDRQADTGPDANIVRGED